MKHKIQCFKCKKIFYHIDHRRRFCSRFCANKFNKKIGENNPMAKKRKIHIENGYRMVWKKNKRVFEHREIMEKHLGRKLKKGEVVHHINNKRNDNKIENLMLFPNNKAHLAYHRIIKITCQK